jgi:hypothetical protein
MHLAMLSWAKHDSTMSMCGGVSREQIIVDTSESFPPVLSKRFLFRKIPTDLFIIIYSSTNN